MGEILETARAAAHAYENTPKLQISLLENWAPDHVNIKFCRM
jgi:hypothetical protein